jgi:LPXTG-motif cell wall-anchored protein
MKWILALLVAGWLGGASGAWAETSLDPVPQRFAAGTSYTLGFWVLQHGTHPYEGELSPVGLRFTSPDGESLTFPGTPLPEAGHYAASVVLPEGDWKIEGLQGMFAPYLAGTVSVPGELKAEPVREESIEGFVAQGVDYWGAVRPPGFPDLPAEPAPVARATAAASAPPPPPPSPPPFRVAEATGVPAWTLPLAAAGGAALAGAGWWLVRRRETEDEEPPRDPSAETIVISG